MRHLVIWILGVCVICPLAASQETVEIKAPAEIVAHEIFVRDTLPLAKPDALGFPLKGVALQITVGADGSVVSAEPVQGDSDYYEQAVQAALQWRFVPFRRKGTVVRARFQASMRIVPPERRPTTCAAFPEIHDWNSLRITLIRTGCFGTCPQYSLVVHGNGVVEYQGDLYTKYCGAWKGTIPQTTVHKLVSYFRAADYFSLFQRYQLDASDLPTFTTSISFANERQEVVDYGGEEVGMPASVSEVERAIDRLAGPEHWVSRRKVDPGTDTSCDSVIPWGPERPLPDRIPSNPKQ